MKIRSDFVTNSSSSSFIVSNRSDDTITSKEFVEKLMSKILEAAENEFTLEPGESIEIECSDGSDGGSFENWIHEICTSWGLLSHYDTSEVDVRFHESHH